MADGTGLLNEHEALGPRGGDSSPSGYQPTEAEQKRIKYINKTFDRYKRHRKLYDRDWLDYYKMFRGKQWQENRPGYRHSEVINMIFKCIQGSVPILTDSRPKFEFLPEEPQDREIAEILNQISESDWQKHNWLYQVTEMFYDAHLYGIGLGSMEWDKDYNYGNGGICFESADPFYGYPDPDATDVNTKAEAWIQAKPVNVDKLKKKYPKYAQFIKADLIDSMSKDDKTEFADYKYRSPTDTRGVYDVEQPSAKYGADQALEITIWDLDGETETEDKQETDEAGNPVIASYEKKKYPRGRKSVLVNNVLVEDGENEYEDGKFPVARLTNYILPREFFGISEVENTKSPQRIFNKLLSFSLDVLTLMGNPIWVIDDTAGIDEENLTNRPGLVVTKSAGSEARRVEGVQLQPYVLQLIDRLGTWFDEQSGQTDVSQGIQPGGVTAASAIATLKDAAQTRLRLKSRNLDACLQSLGQMWVSRTLQFRTVPEIVRLTNNQNATKYFKFSTKQNDDGTRAVVVTRFTQDEETGNHFEQPPVEYQVRGQFDVKVTTGSSLPFAKQEKFEIAKSMFQLGVIDQEELLKAADWPNYEALMQRMQEKAEKDAQMQAQMGPPPPQG